MDKPSHVPESPAGTFRQAIVFSAGQQLLWFLFASMMLDGGMMLRRVVTASVAFFILTLIMAIRISSNTPGSDILLVKWGYLPILLVSCVMWSLGVAIHSAAG